MEVLYYGGTASGYVRLAKKINKKIIVFFTESLIVLRGATAKFRKISTSHFFEI